MTHTALLVKMIKQTAFVPYRKRGKIMKSYDFDCVIFESDYFCVECLPDGTDSNNDGRMFPVFADSETDAPCVCRECGEVHDYMSIIPHKPADTCEVETKVGNLKLGLDMIVNPDWIDFNDIETGRYGARLYCIGQQFGALAIVQGTNEQDAIDIAFDEGKLDCLMIDREDATEDTCCLGNACEPVNLDYAWMIELPVNDWLKQAVNYLTWKDEK